MSFFSVIDARAIGMGAKPINLKVVQGNGVGVTPDIDIVVNRLNKGDKHFHNNGYGGITFKIDVIIHKDELTGNDVNITQKNWKYDNGKVLDYLHNWITNMTPVYVVTEAIDVPNGQYIITKNSDRKQTFREYTVWTLEFTQFKGLNIVKFKNDNSFINKAKKNYAKAKAKARKQSKKAKANNSNKNKLKKCKTSNLKYGVKKSNCVKYMQKVLYKKGYLTKKQIDGWFGPVTKNALKKFQKKYKKKYKLKVTGKVDKSTLKALIDV